LKSCGKPKKKVGLRHQKAFYSGFAAAFKEKEVLNYGNF